MDSVSDPWMHLLHRFRFFATRTGKIFVTQVMSQTITYFLHMSSSFQHELCDLPHMLPLITLIAAISNKPLGVLASARTDLGDDGRQGGSIKPQASCQFTPLKSLCLYAVIRRHTHRHIVSDVIEHHG